MPESLQVLSRVITIDDLPASNQVLINPNLLDESGNPVAPTQIEAPPLVLSEIQGTDVLLINIGSSRTNFEVRCTRQHSVEIAVPDATGTQTGGAVPIAGTNAGLLQGEELLSLDGVDPILAAGQDLGISLLGAQGSLIARGIIDLPSPGRVRALVPGTYVFDADGDAEAATLNDQILTTIFQDPDGGGGGPIIRGEGSRIINAGSASRERLGARTVVVLTQTDIDSGNTNVFSVRLSKPVGADGGSWANGTLSVRKTG